MDDYSVLGASVSLMLNAVLFKKIYIIPSLSTGVAVGSLYFLFQKFQESEYIKYINTAELEKNINSYKELATTKIFSVFVNKKD